ncbi:MAG: YaiO family outer membrane beta-barrel protein [Acidobacteria bacterium]|nr:YaiO family outer membrane beta-barrel protein [Acidobacteriota bacterium]
MNKAFTLWILSLVTVFGVVAAAGQTEKPAPPAAEKTADPPDAEKKPKYEAHFYFTNETLSRNFGTWRTASVYVQRKFADKQIVWANYRISDRNGTRDQEFVGGFYKPLANKWAVTGEGMYSPTYRFVGKFSVMGEVEKVLPKGYVAHFGTRFTKYTTVAATTGYGMIEKYWGNNRAAYTLYVTKLSNAGTAPTHRLQFNHYYGERVNTFGFAVSYGKEHESLGPTLGILRSQTWSLSFSAKHWLTDKFGVSIDGTLHRQGNIYYRRGLTFGVRYRF